MATTLLLPIVAKLGFTCVKHFLGPCTLQAVLPACGSTNGGTIVRITGEGFQVGVIPRVKFTYISKDEQTQKEIKKSIYADGKVIDASTIEVTTPEFPLIQELPSPATLFRCGLRVSQSLGLVYSNPCAFYYYAPPSLVLIEPNRGSCKGKTMVKIYGRGLRKTPYALVRFKSTQHEVILPAKFDETESCFYVSTVPFPCPPFGEVETWVDISLDGQTYTDKKLRKFTFYEGSYPISLGPSMLGEDLWHIRSQGMLCDCAIICEDNYAIAAHRVVLSARVLRMQALFTSSQVSTIRVPYHRHIAAYFLRYIYTGRLIGGLAAVEDVLKIRELGELWDLPKLAQLDPNHVFEDDTDFRHDECDYSDELQSLLDYAVMTDVSVEVNGEHLCVAHKVILSARSPVFRCMFAPNAQWRESVTGKIQLTDVSRETAGLIIKYIYSEECDITGDNCIELLIAADRFCLPRLKQMIAQCLAQWLEVDTCVKVLLASDLLYVPALTPIVAYFVGAAWSSGQLSEIDRELLLCDEYACKAVEKANPTVRLPRRRVQHMLRAAMNVVKTIGGSNTVQKPGTSTAQKRSADGATEDEGSCTLL